MDTDQSASSDKDQPIKTVPSPVSRPVQSEEGKTSKYSEEQPIRDLGGRLPEEPRVKYQEIDWSRIKTVVPVFPPRKSFLEAIGGVGGLLLTGLLAVFLEGFVQTVFDTVGLGLLAAGGIAIFKIRSRLKEHGISGLLLQIYAAISLVVAFFGILGGAAPLMRAFLASSAVVLMVMHANFGVVRRLGVKSFWRQCSVAKQWEIIRFAIFILILVVLAIMNVIIAYKAS